jgi:hypothetical protein
VIEIEEEIAIVIVKGIETGIGVEVAIVIREVPVTLILQILGVLVGAAGAIKKMGEIIDIPTLSAIDQLAVTIVGKNLAEMIVGKITEMTGWEAVEDGTKEVAEAEEAKLIGQSLPPEMNDWSWNCLVLVILESILANMRISQSRLPVRTYHHTSHL